MKNTNEFRIHLLQLSIWTLVILLILNLNASFEYVLGIKRFISPIILILALLIVFKVSTLKLFKPHYLLFGYTLFILLYICVGTISSWAHPDLQHPRTDLWKIIQSNLNSIIITTAFYAYILYAYHTDRLLFFLRNVFWVCNIASVCVLVFGYYDIQVTHIELGERRSGLFANPNEAGLVSNLGVVLGLYLVMHSKKHLWLYILMILLSIFAVLLTLSKAALVVLLVLVIVFLLWFGIRIGRMQNIQRRIVGYAYTGILLIASFLYVNWDKYLQLLSYAQLTRLEQFHDLLSGEINSEITSERDFLFKEAFSLIREHLITGVGLGNISRMKEMGLGSHNTLLMVWGESGTIVFSFFLLFIILILIHVLKLRSANDAFLLLGFWILLVFQSYLVTHNGFDSRISNAVLGILLGYIQINRLGNGAD